MNTRENKQRRPYAEPATRVIHLNPQHIVCQSMPTKDTPTPYQW